MNNHTIKLTEEDIRVYNNKKDLFGNLSLFKDKMMNNVIYCGDFFEFNNLIPTKSIDLIIMDPPYNLTKIYSGTTFNKMNDESYKEYMRNAIEKCLRVLKSNGTMYICGDWKSSFLQQQCIDEFEKSGQCYCINRITWARDKGRGSDKNWKNNIEDILMVVKDKNNYVFNADKVKVKKTVLAPYKDKEGNNKDWTTDDNGNNYRMTYASNIWNDITVPFWSMPENTDHPTQKPEKLYAKLILASSNEGDNIYEPFSGVGTACVTAYKLHRNFIGIEKESEYWMLSQKRLEMAKDNKNIQGYEDGVFKDKK